MATNKLFTNEEFTKLVETLNGIQNHIPENLAPYIWDQYKKVSGSSENRPCYCSSSAAHWRKAVDVCRGYINEHRNEYRSDGEHTAAV